MTLRFRDARADDIPIIAALHNAAAGALTARFGEGPWSSLVRERQVELSMRHSRLRLGTVDRRVRTVLRLATKKPWAIDVAWFTPVKRPLYLSGMSVSVPHHGQGLGRLALSDALAVGRAWPVDAIRLDAWDGIGGAGPFYAKCGFTDCGHATYRTAALVYYELLLDHSPVLEGGTDGRRHR